jgi:hypothetical protein
MLHLRGTPYIFKLLIHLFLSDKKMYMVDSQILDGGPSQRLINSPMVVTSNKYRISGELISISKRVE